MADRLAPITRPNGKIYRPRKLVACEVGEDGPEGVLILGTLDYHVAKPLADQLAAYLLGEGCEASDTGWVNGWYRDGFEGGQRRWVSDEIRGRAGVYFREIVEVEFRA